MGYVIVDLEFNNLKNIINYYGDFFEKYGNFKNIGIENEIIEIGAIKVDKYMKPVKKFKKYIKPTIFPIINPMIYEITKINMDILEKQGVTFKEAMDEFKEIFEEGDVICSWAKDDIAELIINSHYHNYTDLNWLNQYLDIQEYATKILAHKKVLGLKTALDELKIKVDNEKLHDALNDSEYTMEVFKRIYNSRIVKNYVVKDIYNMPAINISNIQEIKIDQQKLKLKCPKCGKKVDLQTDINLLNWRFGAIGFCSKCKNNILCEILVKRTLQGEEVYTEVNTILKEDRYIKYKYRFDNIDNASERK